MFVHAATQSIEHSGTPSTLRLFLLRTPFHTTCFATALLPQNVINGGEHAGNKLAFQEFFVIPTGAATFKEGIQIGCEVFHNLKAVIKGKVRVHAHTHIVGLPSLYLHAGSSIS